MKRRLQHLIEVLAGAGDSDSVTRRLRLSLASQRSRPPAAHRGVIAGLVDAMTGRDTAHASIRQLALRRDRER